MSSIAYEREPLFFAYVKWHYGKGIKELLGVAGNFLWFVANFFSFKLLFSTLFSPWKRLGEKYQGGLDLGAWAGTLIVNTLMRLVGFVTRTTVLAIGFAAFLSVLVFFVFIIVVWLLVPAILLGCAVLAVTFFVI